MSARAQLVLAAVAGGILCVGLLLGGIALGYVFDDEPAAPAPAAAGGGGAEPTTDPGSVDGGGSGSGDVPAREPLSDIAAIAATLPDGFEVRVYADGIPYPTAMAVGSDGTLYVGTLKDERGAVLAYAPAGDRAEKEPTLVAEGFSTITGLLESQDGLYVASRGSVALLVDADRDGTAEDRRELIADLPAVYPVHANNGMAMGPDGLLYFGVGATCNACDEETELAASIVRCRPDGTGCEAFATGLRNPYGLAFHPEDGTLLTTDNGAEAIGGAELEIEDELNVVVEGGDYGWPFCWGIEKGLDCAGTLPALAEIQPHAAPAGLAFYTGDAFPAEYRNNLFVTLWGDTGRSVLRVVLTRDGEAGYEVTFEDFVRMNRPVDVVTGADGRLLVADSDAGTVYAIGYAR